MYSGIELSREVFFASAAGVVILDRYFGRPVESLEQRFMLSPECEVIRQDVTGVHVELAGDSHVAIQQLLTTDDVEISRGQVDPLLGWISWKHGEMQPTAHVAFTTDPEPGLVFATLIQRITEDSPFVWSLCQAEEGDESKHRPVLSLRSPDGVVAAYAIGRRASEEQA